MKLAHSSQNQEDKEPSGKSRFRRTGIYLLPNLLTTSALFAGFYAIIAAMSGRFEIASIVILVAIVFDGLDGRPGMFDRLEENMQMTPDDVRASEQPSFSRHSKSSREPRNRIYFKKAVFFTPPQNSTARRSSRWPIF